MNMKLISSLTVTTLLATLASIAAESKDTPPPPAAASTAGPKIQFDSIVYDFTKVNSGEVVKHDFVFTNLGAATLEILDVRPGCGCTTAGTWDKKVEPGKTGIIPLQFNSANFGGSVLKQATVTCNDPGQSNVILQIKGTVWKPIDVTPTMAVFNVSSETQTNETKVVRIVNNLDEPLTLSDLQCSNQTFKAELKTVKEGKEFELQITAMPPFNGTTIMAPISMKTSSAKMSNLNVTAYAIVQQAVTVMPNQIMLQPGPFTNLVHHTVTVRNNGTNSLVLSDAKANVPEVTVNVQETQAGRYFNVTVDFPVGFQLQPGQKVEVTMKSNHPKFPLLTVPVFQPQRPAASAATPGVTPVARIVPGKTAPPATEK